MLHGVQFSHLLGVGRIPTSIYFFVQETARYEGSLTKSSLRMPRVFTKSGSEPCGIKSVQLTIANQDSDGLFEPEPDQLFSLNYFKYYVMQDMLDGGAALPACKLKTGIVWLLSHLSFFFSVITPEEFNNDFFFVHFNLTCSLNNR